MMHSALRVLAVAVSRRGRLSHRARWCVAGFMLAWCTASAVFAGEARNYRSYAEVVNVEPIMETWYEPVSRRECNDPDYAAREFTEVAATIGADVRRQISLWQQQRACRTITENRTRERIAAYRVTYRYSGRTSTTRLSYDPGARMRVDVSLSPLR